MCPPVHPRPRGEHRFAVMQDASMVGSSPPARGTRIARIRRFDDSRFIPARAGNTRTHPASPSSASVHPRPRGEHITSGFARIEYSGSSPPARGTLHPDLELLPKNRFIPARAGNTT